ncbi:uncharacterized protein LOC129770087 isoform X2 [Toxorhynchites rutilus septentrionalis]|nr:uncharacterized protein LOC129770087 isoform X2 [Toxorhynchites rutilus septentrionalis]
MTFEARDSAAKVVPARFKLSGNARNTSRNNTSRRSTTNSNGPGPVGPQTARWEQHLGVFRTSPAVEQVPDRKALTAALVHFSRALGTPKATREQLEGRRMSRSDSVPNLTADKLTVPLATGSPAGVRSLVRQPRGSRVSSMVHRSTRETNGSLLHPGMLQFHRHALSVDRPEPLQANLKQTGSHGSMHYGSPSDMPIVHKLRDRTKRSDTARKHVLSRQTKIEKDEPGSPKPNPFANSRRSSTISNASSKLNKSSSRRASTISKTPSVDSRGAASTVEVTSTEPSLLAMTPRRGNNPMAQMSTSPSSMEKECRSQPSICSDPTGRQLSCQSSLEPCVPEEESPELEEVLHDMTATASASSQQRTNSTHANDKSNRPDTLVLGRIGDGPLGAEKTNRFLYRSNSTKSFRKPKPKIKCKKLSNEFDQIYVISSSSGNEYEASTAAGSNRYPNFHHARDDEYDSIEVIYERRSKNFSKFNNTGGDEHQPQERLSGKQESDDLCPVGESLGLNKFSVVADISPAIASVHTSPDKIAERTSPARNDAGNGSFAELSQQGEGSTDKEDSGIQDTNFNSSIQRYDTVIYNASASVESEEASLVTVEGNRTD